MSPSLPVKRSSMRFNGLSVFLCLLVVTTFGSQTIQSFPTGIGSLGDNGCTCHGGFSNATQPTIIGLPDAFEENVSYNFTLVAGSDKEYNEGEVQAGFRILASKGTVIPANETRIQYLDEGWTHTEEGNQYRHWNITWKAPSDNTTTVDFILYANVVNGNGHSDGDMWNAIGYTVPGTQYEGPVETIDPAEQLNSSQYTILYGGLIVLVIFLYYALK